MFNLITNTLLQEASQAAQFIVLAPEPEDFKLIFPPSFNAVIRFVEDMVPKLIACLRCAGANLVMEIEVKRSNDDERYYLGAGWTGFVTLANARKGTMLLFKYEGALEFDVTVYEPSYMGHEGVQGFEAAMYEYIGRPLNTNPIIPIVGQNPVPLDESLIRPFERTITKYSKSQMAICKKFATEARIRERKQVKMTMYGFHPSPTCTVTVNDKEGNAFRFGPGWRLAYNMMDFQIGDKCKFYMNMIMTTSDVLYIDMEKITQNLNEGADPFEMVSANNEFGTSKTSGMEMCKPY